MKKFKLMTVVMLLSVFFVGFSACSDDDDDKKETEHLIVGKWREITDRGYSEYVEFKSSGTFEYTNTDPSDEGYKEVGKWKIEGDKLHQMFSDEDDWIVSKIVELTSTSLILDELDEDGISYGFTDDYQRVNK